MAQSILWIIMRMLKELTMNERFNNLLQSIKESAKNIKVLSFEPDVFAGIQEKYDIKPESLLGTIIHNCGGIVIDNWVRIYGAGKLDFAARNQLFPYGNIVVGEDILGGLFVILDGGNIGYFAPDALEIEDMEINFSQFLYWCIQGDTDTFYQDYRWSDWQNEVADMDLNKGVAFYPFLWAQAEYFEGRRREQMPMKEIIGMEFEFLRQFGE